MDLEDLKTFEHLAGTLHFGRSARARGMSASALTRRIQALEAELGQKLLVRDQRQVQLSPAGLAFLQFARRQVAEWAALQASLRAGEQNPVGELNIACTVTACHTLLPRILGQFRRRYPSVTLRLLTQDAGQSRSQLEAGELDLAVIPTEGLQVEGLAVLPLATTALEFIAPRDLAALGPGFGARVEVGPDIPLVAPAGGLERQRLGQWLKRRRVVPRIVAEVRGNEAIIAMVSLGCGVGFVPELVLASSPLGQQVRPLEHWQPPSGYHVSLCARPRSLERRVVQVFWQLAEELRGPAPPRP